VLVALTEQLLTQPDQHRRRAWKDRDAYQEALERVLRDLRVEMPDSSAPKQPSNPPP
jgi:hypothetical protein